MNLYSKTFYILNMVKYSQNQGFTGGPPSKLRLKQCYYSENIGTIYQFLRHCTITKEKRKKMFRFSTPMCWSTFSSSQIQRIQSIQPGYRRQSSVIHPSIHPFNRSKRVCIVSNNELPAVRRTITIGQNFFLAYVQLLQWLHGKQQQYPFIH